MADLLVKQCKGKRVEIMCAMPYPMQCKTRRSKKWCHDCCYNMLAYGARHPDRTQAQ